MLANMRAAKAQSRTTNEFQRSNSTTNAFIGGTQKAWMTGQSGESTRDPSTPKSAMPKARDQAPIISHRAELAPEVHKAVKNSNLPNTAFGPDSDHGCYPVQRQSQGGTKNHSRSSSISLAASSNPPILFPPALEENPYVPPANSMDVSTNAENVLPSPSPSVEARQNSVNVVEIEDEGHQPQAAEAHPVDEAPTATLEELVTRCGDLDRLKRLVTDAGKSNYGPSQIAASAVGLELHGASPSSGPRRREWAPSLTNPPRPECDHDIPAPSIANKRPQEFTDEPRKRLQSLPGSSFEDPFANPWASAVLPSQNGQSSAAASPSGTEMRLFSQTLTQRMQLVGNMPDREGNHVERPRLGLLREACESSDYFYLVLHQLFCFDYEIRKLNGEKSGLNGMHRKGLDVVAFLLVSNEEMVDNAVKWFSEFPLLLGDLITNRPEFASAHAKVLRCLEKMATSWDDMRSQCTKRKYPPLVDELVVLFNVESFLFQQIIFRAVLRDIWVGKPDKCFHITEEVFNRDYREVMNRLSLASMPVALVKLYQQAVIKQYLHALEYHRQHTPAGPTASMAPPRQQQSQSRLAPANHNSNNRNMSQSEYNLNTQSPLTLDLHAAQRLRLSSAPGPAPIAPQANQSCRQGNLLSQSQQNLASNPFPSPQVSSYTQSPTNLQSFFSPGASMNSPGQWNGQQQQRERSTSSTAGQSVGAPKNPHDTPQSTTPTQRTAHMVPSNVPGNPHIYQLQQNTGLQQQSHHRVPSSSIVNPRLRPQPEVRRLLSSRTNETSPPSPLPLISPSPSLPNHADFTPFIRSYPPLPTHPNPTTSALHQAHLRSPTLSYFDMNEKPSSVPKCYRFISNVLMPPEELDSKNRHVNWDFRVDKELTDWFAHDTHNSHGAPPTRAIVPGSRLCRIRCISLKEKTGMPTESEWAVADNVWPGSTAVVLNGIALDIRKKSHHGKDLPIDVTSYIKEGQNNLSSAIIGLQKDSTTRYAIGAEFIMVVDEQKIKIQMKVLPWLEARKRILDQSKNMDPDIEVMQSQRVLDLTDPFTARIFGVPVRGINCHHNQCFDRDTFLQTRTAKTPGEPCGPDEFRCPICGQDARPQSLMIDSFFLGVRMGLKERGRLDAKAIILHDSGEWEIKEEEEATGESGDGTGRTSEGLAPARTASASVARQSAPREVIELDDD